eukprot:COSAG01_NODE_4817_length_4724_cov_3.025081_3_plen_93_part_00
MIRAGRWHAAVQVRRASEEVPGSALVGCAMRTMQVALDRCPRALVEVLPSAAEAHGALERILETRRCAAVRLVSGRLSGAQTHTPKRQGIAQ